MCEKIESAMNSPMILRIERVGCYIHTKYERTEIEEKLPLLRPTRRFPKEIKLKEREEHICFLSDMKGSLRKSFNEFIQFTRTW